MKNCMERKKERKKDGVERYPIKGSVNEIFKKEDIIVSPAAKSCGSSKFTQLCRFLAK